MIALFFEVTPWPGQDDRYLEIATSLRPELERSGGCNFLDRFRSLARPRTMLSHQLWVDEASLARWRANQRHNGAQVAGRSAVFEDYRLRVGAVVAEAAPGKAVAEHAPGIAYNDPALRRERWMLVVRSREAPFVGEGEAWRSVYRDTDFAFVGVVADREAGLVLLRRAAADGRVDAAQLVLVSRDYGMHERGEAPQFFPASDRPR